MKVAVIGATGLVGSKILQVLEERKFPITELIPIASERSIGKKVVFDNVKYSVCTLAQGLAANPSLALFSSGSETSVHWVPKYAESEVTVIDNSSAWRMHPQVKLIVPEINAGVLRADDKIIANPNCSTIQMVVALHPLHQRYKIKRIVVSTYQSVSGSGIKSMLQLTGEREKVFFPGEGQTYIQAYQHPIDLNVIPQVDVFVERGYTREELKMVNETQKILGDNSIRLTATAVRVPVSVGHSESINVEFDAEFDLQEVYEILSQSPGITVLDDPLNSVYPMPLHAEDKDDVFVGRVRRDESQANTLNLWVVSDNLRKGAATNAVQIAEYLLYKGFL